MRSWINLFEAPIVDFEFRDHGGSSFTPPEQKSLTSPRGQQRYFKAFERTPFNFKILFINNSGTDATEEWDNDHVDELAVSMNAGVYATFKFHNETTKQFEIVDGEPGVIKMVSLSNLSPTDDRMPMTPWMLAHKMGHSIQDQIMKKSKSDINLLSYVSKINEALVAIGNSVELNLGLRADGIYSFKKFDYPSHIMDALTMRFAQKTRVFQNMFEVFPEVIAQYLITGKVTLKDVFSDTNDTDVLEEALNEAIENLLNAIVGKVLVEV